MNISESALSRNAPVSASKNCFTSLDLNIYCVSTLRPLDNKLRNELRAHGIRWGYVFLRTTSHIPELEELLVQAVEMYLMGEEERIVKTSNYEGKLFTQRRDEILGGLGGQRFDAELEEVVVCTHHWIIETPDGPVSKGRCRLCRAEREFSNSFETGGWNPQNKGEK